MVRNCLERWYKEEEKAEKQLQVIAIENQSQPHRNGGEEGGGRCVHVTPPVMKGVVKHN